MENMESKEENQPQQTQEPKESTQQQPIQKTQQTQPQQTSQPKEDRRGSAIASFILGFLSFIPFLGFLTLIIGIILGILGLKSSKKGLAIAGIILCIIGQIVAVVIIISLGFLGVKKATTEVKGKVIEGTMETFAQGAKEFYDVKKTYIGLEKGKTFDTAKKAIDFGGGKNFAVNTSKRAYCAETQKANGKWWCTDSKGISKEYENNPACSSTHYLCN
jgi:hypothetical protein